MTRVLVTGAAGFIGSRLVDSLRRTGHDVVASDMLPAPEFLRSVPWLSCDLRDASAVTEMLATALPSAILHLGARTDLDEKHDLGGYAANIEGVSNLLNAIALVGGVERTICTSTQLVVPSGYTVKSDEDFCPTTLYGASKVESERIWRRLDGAGTDWCIVRPTTIWGPRMHPHYHRFFRMIRAGHYRHVGHAQARKSYGYVGNTVAQYVALLRAPAAAIRRKVFYLADYEPIVLQVWADAFASALAAPRIKHIPAWMARSFALAGDALNMVGFNSFPFNSFRLNNVLGERTVDTRSIQSLVPVLPFTSVAGIEETVTWLNECVFRAS